MSELQSREEIEGHYAAAMKNLVGGNLEPAYAAFRNLLVNYSSYFESGFLELRLGTVCYHLGKKDPPRFKEAVNYLLTGRNKIDKQAFGFEYLRSLDLLGQTHWLLHNFKEACRFLEEGRENLEHYQPDRLALDYYLFRVLLGNVYVLLGRYDEAITEFEAARTKAPLTSEKETNNTEIDFELGRVYHYSGNAEKASLYLGAVHSELLSESYHFSYYYTLLLHNTDQSRYQDALICMKHLEKIGIPDEHRAACYHYAGVASYCLNELDGAIRYFELSQASSPSVAWIKEHNTGYLAKIRQCH